MLKALLFLRNIGMICSTLAGGMAYATEHWADAVAAAVADPDRTVEDRMRDEFRHPQQTLRFFGIEPQMTVVEISPGGGWYTHILAPLVEQEGKLYAAHFYIDDNTNDYFKNSRAGFEKKTAPGGMFEHVKLTSFHPLHALDVAPPNSADAVLTFRNVHNWYMRQGDKGVENAFKAFYKALKPGGILGVVEHRLPEDANDDKMAKSGYMKQSYVINMAKKAGFKLQKSSEINANLLDTSDHPKGVWTLPPRLALGDENREKYLAIGESDRMTLKFVKP